MARGICDHATEAVRSLPVEVKSFVKTAKQIVRNIAVTLDGHAAQPFHGLVEVQEKGETKRESKVKIRRK